MPIRKPSHPVLQYLRRVRATGSSESIGDADLLQRFAVSRDEAAFELLVWRHGAMVQRVCRGVLRNDRSAEDAFQATFLALARKAASVAGHASPAAWLYRVAYRVALKARTADLRRAAREMQLIPRPGPPPADAAAETAEYAAMLHEEVNRLSARYRTPVVLCYFEGKTYEEAAHELGLSTGTVSGRLARARDLLKRRLIRRGIVVPATGLAVILTGAAEASVSGALTALTARAAVGYVSAGSVPATGSMTAGHLATGVIHDMFMARVKAVALICLVAGLLVGGLGFLPGRDSSGVALAEPPPNAEAAKPGPAPESLLEFARQRLQSLQKLRVIGIALFTYLDTYGRFPADFTDAQGRPTLSWRVALLRFMAIENNPFKQFKFDEPWDGPNNKKLLKSMPNFLRAPTQSADATETFYQGFVGPGAMFENGPQFLPGEGAPVMGTVPAGADGPEKAFKIPGHIRLIDVRDGSSNTLFVVEAGTAVPWTKPDDIPFDPKKSLPGLGGAFPHVINALFVDGTVYSLRRDFKESVLRGAITRNGGENVDREELKEPRPRLRGREAKKAAPGSANASTAAEDAELLRLDNERLREDARVSRFHIFRTLTEVEPLREQAARREDAEEELKRLVEANAALEVAAGQMQTELQKLRDELARLKKTSKK